MFVRLNWHFSLLSISPASLFRARTAVRHRSCSFCVSPNTRISSTRHTTPSTPLTTWPILLWKCSGAEVIPKGNQLKQYLPKGVMKVVSRAESRESSTCQNPELASSFENILAAPIWANVFSTDGNIWRSRHTLSFNLVKSTQILTWPLGFGTTAIPVHHSVDCSTLEITFKSSIL